MGGKNTLSEQIHLEFVEAQEFSPPGVTSINAIEKNSWLHTLTNNTGAIVCQEGISIGRVVGGNRFVGMMHRHNLKFHQGGA